MVSGFLILWIVAHHACQFSKIPSLEWVFIMIPWFFFKSGMFFRPDLKCSIIEQIKRRIKTLIIPLLFWGAFGYLILFPILINIYQQELWKIIFLPLYHLLLSGDFLGNTPLWFLFSLFCVQVLSFFFVKFKYFFIGIILLLVVGFYMERSSVILPLGASIWPLGLFFYFSGFIYIKYLGDYDLKNFIIITLPLFVIFNLFSFSYVDVHVNKVQYGNYFAFVLLSLFGIIYSIYFSKFMKFNFLVWTGQRSLYFFVIHWPIFNIVKYLYKTYVGKPAGYGYFFILLLSACLGSVLIIKILDKYRNKYKLLKYL